MRTTEIRELSAFGRLVQNRSRNLSLLKLIETTLARLDEQLMEVQLANDAADRFIARIKEHGIVVDEDTDLVATFEDARDQMGEFYRLINECHIAAATDAELSDKDGIVEVFARLVDETAELHNKLNTLAWLIGESIADSETPIEQEFTSADALFASLR